ncbi:hypothetical protein CVT25_002409 [Psilocybe cyanescens]|uniref:Uncharacterized protein n=1 Tax=Psilocybe cyanescens TaxID=93625 RepID=A0A409WK52_PSICY|nr:hypothetical protein CVT25_002409 [Psilocybe cyanescens]
MLKIFTPHYAHAIPFLTKVLLHAMHNAQELVRRHQARIRRRQLGQVKPSREKIALPSKHPSATPEKARHHKYIISNDKNNAS